MNTSNLGIEGGLDGSRGVPSQWSLGPSAVANEPLLPAPIYSEKSKDGTEPHMMSIHLRSRDGGAVTPVAGA